MKTGFEHRITRSSNQGLTTREKIAFENSLEERAEKKRSLLNQVFKTMLKLNAKKQQEINRIIGPDKLEQIEKFKREQKPIVVHLKSKSGISANDVKVANRKQEQKWNVFSNELKIDEEALTKANDAYFKNVREAGAKLLSIGKDGYQAVVPPAAIIGLHAGLDIYHPPFLLGETVFSWVTKGDNLAFIRQITNANCNNGRMLSSMELDGHYEDVDQSWSQLCNTSMYLAHINRSTGKIKITITLENEYGRIYHAGHSGSVATAYWSTLIVVSQVNAVVRIARIGDPKYWGWIEEASMPIRFVHSVASTGNLNFDDSIIPNSSKSSFPLNFEGSIISETLFKAKERSLWIEVSIENSNWGLMSNFDGVHVDLESYWKLAEVRVETV